MDKKIIRFQSISRRQIKHAGKIRFSKPILLFFSLTCLIIVFFTISHLLPKTSSKNITADYGCAMGSEYNYIVKNNYPILVFRRMDLSQKPSKELIKFSNLPATESDFMKLASLSKAEAVSKIDNLTLSYSRFSVPKPSQYSLSFKKEDAQDVQLIRLRTNFCSKAYPLGTIDSAVRVVWEIKTISHPNNSDFAQEYGYNRNWTIYVDAVTGEIVKAVRSDLDLPKMPVPGWDQTPDLPKIGDEYLQLVI